ncbi:hypothetical protein LCGC14_0485800 [marine sediment metagenome]|uniref:Arc-like DNA binding domain-containing protein n=1 Tax=marine sediment metagenome TaxID=412755 RepID=A0A0F9VGU4_9ZZZZ
MKDDNKNTVEMRIRDVPKDIHKQFTHLCLDEDKTISTKVIELVREYVSKNKHKVLK